MLVGRVGGKSAHSSTPPAFRDQLGIPCEGALLPEYGSESSYVFGGAEATLCQDIPASKPNHSITPLCVEPFPTSLPAPPSPIPVGERGKLPTEFRLALGVLDSETPPRRRVRNPALPLSLDCFVGHRSVDLALKSLMYCLPTAYWVPSEGRDPKALCLQLPGSAERLHQRCTWVIFRRIRCWQWVGTEV